MMWLGILLSLLVIVVSACLLRKCLGGKESYSKWLVASSNVVMTLAIVAGAIYGVQTLQISRNRQKAEVLHQFFKEWNSSEFEEIQEEVTNKRITTAHDLEGNPITLCNFFERLGMYERDGIIRIEDVHRAFGDWPCRYWNLFEKGIDDWRRELDRPPHYPRSLENFEILCKHIKEFESKEYE